MSDADTSAAGSTYYQYRQSVGRLGGIIVIDALIGLCLWFTPIGKILDVVLALALLGLIVGYFTQSITIEDNMVTLTKGIISQKTTEIPLNKINSVTIQRGLFGHMFDFGTLIIATGNDTTGIKFVGLDRPNIVKRRLKNSQST